MLHMSTILYENNATCIAQLKDDYIKGDKTKYIFSNYFLLMIFRKNVI